MRRSVQFWELTDDLKRPLSKRFPSKKLIELLAGVQTAGHSMSFTHRDGVETIMEVFSTAERPHLCLHGVRRVNMPLEEQKGRIVDLSIPAGNGLAEGTHFVFFPRNVVACVYNHHGPRVRRLAQWLEGQLGMKIDFRPVYRQDVLAVLEQFERVTSVEVSLPATQAKDLADVQGDDYDVAGALRNAGERLPDGGTVRLVYSAGRAKNSGTRDFIRGFAKALASRDDVDPQHFGTAKVWGYLPNEGAITPLDLVEDQLIALREIEPESERSKRLSAPAALAACDSVYAQFKQQISESVAPIEAAYLSLPSDPPISRLT